MDAVPRVSHTGSTAAKSAARPGTRDGERPLVSVIVVNWNGLAYLPECLDSPGRADLSGARDRGGGKRVHRRLRGLCAISARGACASWKARATSASPGATIWAFARPRAPTWLSSTTTPPPIPGGSTRWWRRPRPTPPWACARRGSTRGGGRSLLDGAGLLVSADGIGRGRGASSRMGSATKGSGCAPAERLRRPLSALHAR